MSITRIITEIGEGKFSYDFRLHRDEESPERNFKASIYRFRSDENDYSVFLSTLDTEKEYIDVTFNIRGEKQTGKKNVPVTGEDNALKVISTVLNIVKDFHRRNPSLRKYKFSPPFFDKMDKGKRVKIYKRFIKRAFPNAKITRVPLNQYYVKI